jgi:hypothetical protein
MYVYFHLYHITHQCRRKATKKELFFSKMKRDSTSEYGEYQRLDIKRGQERKKKGIASLICEFSTTQKSTSFL